MTTTVYKNPIPVVDAIITCHWLLVPRDDGSMMTSPTAVLLIERKKAPFGWAFPGGYVNAGERFLEAAERELLEETGIKVPLQFFGIYDDPTRDPRGHNVSTVFHARVTGKEISNAKAADDAASLRWFDVDQLINRGVTPLAFDHLQILKDYRKAGMAAYNLAAGYRYAPSFNY